MKEEARFVVDELTNSIREVSTGKIFETEVVPIGADEIKQVYKKDGWFFSWKVEFKEAGKQLYKLVLEGESTIQGIISLEPVPNQLFIEMHLIESAPHNHPKHKQFAGVAGNLVAFVCRMSFDLGFEGFVAFTAKTNLIQHYVDTLGAQVIYGQNRMGIFTPAAKKLVNSYYKEYFNGG